MPALGLTVLALSVGLAGAGARPAHAAVDPIGAHSMLQLDDPPSFMQAMFAQAAAMHAAAIRLDVAPALIFTSPSQPPDFSGLDEVVALAQTYHLQVVADLLTIPTWMAQCATPTSTPSRCATGDLPAYGSVIAQIVRRADPVIRDWEVWNEPDNGEFFDGTPQQYAGMLRTAHDAIKSVDPADDVLLGGISGVMAEGWLAQVFAASGADAVHAFDVANLHERGDLWQLAPDVAGFRHFLATQGFAGPLWVTEHGYPSDPQYQYDPAYTGGECGAGRLPGGVAPHVGRRGRRHGLRHRARQPQRVVRVRGRAGRRCRRPTPGRPGDHPEAGVRRRAGRRRLLRAVRTRLPRHACGRVADGGGPAARAARRDEQPVGHHQQSRQCPGRARGRVGVRPVGRRADGGQQPVRGHGARAPRDLCGVGALRARGGRQRRRDARVVVR